MSSQAQTREQPAKLAEENLRLNEAISRRTQRSAVLARIYSRIRSAPDLPVVLQVVVEEIGRNLGATRCFVSLDVELPELPPFYEYTIPGIAPLAEASSPRRLANSARMTTTDGSQLIMPIMQRHEVLGMIGVQRNQPEEWTPGETELVTHTAGGLSLLLANARLLTENERRTREINQLQAVAQIVTEETDRYRLVERLAERAMELIRAEQAMVGLTVGDITVINQLWQRGRWERVDLRFRPGEGVAGWVLVNGRPYLSQDATADPHVDPDFARRFNCRTILAVPILNRHQHTLGIIEFHNRRDRQPFEDEDVRHVQAIAHQAAIALERAQLFEEVQQRANALETLLSFSAELNEQLNPETLIRRLVEHATSLVGASAGLGGLVEPTGLLTHFYWQGGEWHDYEVDWSAAKGLAGWVLAQKRSYLTNDYRHDEWGDVRLMESFDVRAALCVPILDASDQVLGFFEVHNKADGREPFSWADVGMMESLANVVAVAIRNGRLFNELENQGLQLRALSAQLVTILEDERRRIARELHDEAGQALIGIKLNLQVLAHSIPSELVTLREEVDRLRQQVNEATGRLHALSRRLRPPTLDELGLEAALHRLTADIEENSGIVVYFETADLASRLPQAVEIACYRIVQEALTNVVRHAEADHVWVSLALDKNTIRLFIQDDGRGFDLAHLAPSGLGLLGMRERATMLGGRLTIHSNQSHPGKGTKIEVTIPITILPEVANLREDVVS